MHTRDDSAEIVTKIRQVPPSSVLAEAMALFTFLMQCAVCSDSPARTHLPAFASSFSGKSQMCGLCLSL